MQLPTIEGIESALEPIRPYLAETPLVRSELLSQILDADVWLKNEAVSPVGSFKLRGALTEVHRASRAGRIGGVVTSSTGNHGQGVAFAARLLGIPAHIFLPLVCNPLKKMMISKFGGVVHSVGHDFDAAKGAAKAFATEREYLLIDDGEGLGVMEGAGTIGLEVARLLPSIDAIYIPMGAGALAGGCGAAVKALQKSARVIAVQAKGAPAMVESFHARRPVPRPIDPDTVADGLTCREPPQLGLAAILKFVDDAISCGDTELLSGVRTLVESAHVLVEPAGAASIAGAWSQRQGLKDRRVVLVLTGANITLDVLRRALSTGPLFVMAAGATGEHATPGMAVR
jgi:threonine dehydratase